MDMNNNQKNEETRRRRYEDKLYHNRMNKAFWTKRCIFLALFLALVAITLLLFFKQGWLVPKVVMIILLIISMILDFLFLGRCPYCDFYITSRLWFMDYCPHCGESLSYSHKLEKQDKQTRQERDAQTGEEE